MAIEVVHSAQTTGGTTNSLAITEATKGNILVSFYVVKGSTEKPTLVKDSNNKGTWTINATSAVLSGSGDSVWVATKEAEGGEKEVAWTSAGTAQGVCCFELKGASQTIDTIVHKDNQTTAKAVTSPEVTTTDAGDVVLAAAGLNGASATTEEWSGTGPMTKISATSTRCIGGSYIPGSTLSKVTFTAHWATEHNAGMLVVAIKPAGGAVTLTPSAAAASTATSMSAVATGVVVPTAAAAVTAASAAVVATAIVEPAATVASTSTSMTAMATVTLTPSAASASTSTSATLVPTIFLTPSAAVASTSRSATLVLGATTVQLEPEPSEAVTFTRLDQMHATTLLSPSAASASTSTSLSATAVVHFGLLGAVAETRTSALLFIPGGFVPEPPTSATFATKSTSVVLDDVVSTAVFSSKTTSVTFHGTVTVVSLRGG